MPPRLASGLVSQLKPCPRGPLLPRRAYTQRTSPRWLTVQIAAVSSQPADTPHTGRTGAVLVCPGFLASSSSYEGLADGLRSRGFHTEVVQLQLRDWLPTTFRGESFRFYVERLDTALQQLYEEHGPVAIVGHSAGGWVPRILLGDQPYEGKVYGRRHMVHTLVTLGTPHQSLELYPFGRVEEHLSGSHLDAAPPPVRGSSLKFANHFYPRGDCFEGVRVVCIVGDAIRGRALWGPLGSQPTEPGKEWPYGGEDGLRLLNGGSMWGSSFAGGSAVDYSTDEEEVEIERWEAHQPSRLDQYLAHQCYRCGCGQGNVDGDGVTPIQIAHLPGARNLILPGVWHNPGGGPAKPWYGDPAVLERWVQHLEPPCFDKSTGSPSADTAERGVASPVGDC